MFEKQFGDFSGVTLNRNYEYSHSKQELSITDSNKTVTPDEIMDILKDKLGIENGTICIHSITYTYIKQLPERRRNHEPIGGQQIM